MHLVTKHVFSKRSSVVRCVIGCMNGSTLSLAIAREPGRIGWVTGRTYTMGATPVYGWQASHDALGRPVSTADSESAARSWTYNARSEMTGCTGEDLSGTEQGAGGVGGLLWLTVDGTIYIPCYDNNGNVTRYLNVNGGAIARYSYDAFGRLIAKTGRRSSLFRHRFSTKYFDSETGLYYYGYRFYHPDLMCWLNRDPIGEEGGAPSRRIERARWPLKGGGECKCK